MITDLFFQTGPADTAPRIALRGVLFVTGSEKKIDILLIDTFRKGFSPYKNGHLEAGGLF